MLNDEMFFFFSALKVFTSRRVNGPETQGQRTVFLWVSIDMSETTELKWFWDLFSVST